MFEVGSRGERIDYSVRKTFFEDAVEAGAKLFACDSAGGARRIGAQKFQAAWFCAAKPLHFQDDAIFRALFYTQNSARQIALVRPQMHQRLIAFAVYFTLQRSEFGEPLAVFANFHAAGRSQIAQGAIECRPILRRRDQWHTASLYVGESILRYYCRIRPVTLMDGY